MCKWVAHFVVIVLWRVKMSIQNRIWVQNLKLQEVENPYFVVCIFQCFLFSESLLTLLALGVRWCLLYLLKSKALIQFLFQIKTVSNSISRFLPLAILFSCRTSRADFVKYTHSRNIYFFTFATFACHSLHWVFLYFLVTYSLIKRFKYVIIEIYILIH